jgi:putative alpha-1,2-mannosidase
MRAALAAASAAALSAAVAYAAAPANPSLYVNTLTGTQSRYDLSHGNILPNVVRPWAFQMWAPQTDNDQTWSSWWFHPSDARFFGIRCTRQPSPWISDYGQVSAGERC